MGRRVALAARVGALLGLAWWVLFGLIAAGVVCTKDDFGCLGTAVVTVPVFAVAAWALGWLALRSYGLRMPWLIALCATVVGVLAMVQMPGLPHLALIVFAITYALAALFG